MRLVCITTEYNHYGSCPIEVGKLYDVVDLDRTWDDEYKMIHIDIGDGQHMEFVKKCFIPLEDHRNNKIEKILN